MSAADVRAAGEAAGAITLRLGDETARLHPERAVELPARRALVVADVHWGKAATLRAHGIPVPTGGTREDLARLDRVLSRTGATSLVVLGDLVHSRHAWDARALAPVRDWRARRPSLSITLVPGNHDRHAGPPPDDLGIAVVEAPHALGTLACHHEPPAGGASSPFAVHGHLHPTVRLRGPGGERLRLPCFVLGTDALILPAFSTFTGSGAWQARPGDQVFAIAESDVFAFVPRPR